MRRARVPRRRSPGTSTITSLTAANRALEQLRRGKASLVKCVRRGRPEMILRSEESGSAWETKIGSGHTHLFQKFFEENGNGDGLFAGTHQTAKIETTEQKDQKNVSLGRGTDCRRD
jgi:hypothetical protein